MTTAKRKQERIPCDILINKVESGHMHICRATNISLGGMRIQKLLEPLRNGRREKVRLEFELPGDLEPIRVGAKKVYQQGEFMGVRFTDISHQHFVRLRNWLRDSGQDRAIPVV